MAKAEKTTKKPTTNGEAKQRNLDDAMAQITKTYGEGSIMRLGSARRAIRPNSRTQDWAA